MTNIKTTLAAVLITAGLGLTVWQERRVQALNQEKVDLQAELTELPDLRAEVERLQGATADPGSSVKLENERLEASREIASLQGQLSMAQAQLTRQAQQEAPPPVAEEPETPAPKINEMVQATMRMAARTQTLGKLPGLTERLALSPEQAEAVRGILQRQFNQTLELSEKVLKGELKPGDTPSTKEPIVNPTAEIRALLTPEQQEAYHEYQEEEHSSNARLAANGQLLQMQTPLGLSQEQQDPVSQALYQHTFDTMTNKKGPPADRARDYASSMQWSIDSKAEALADVLTPEQLEKYRQLEAEKLKIASRMMTQQ